MMNCHLAVLAPKLGARSETFIQRHMCELLPGRTAVVAGSRQLPEAGHWTCSGPVLILDEIRRGSLVTRISRRLAKARYGDPRAYHIERFLARHGSRAILGQFLNWSVAWVSASKRWGVPMFAHAHGHDVSAAIRDPKVRDSYRQFNDIAGVITMSQVSRQRLIDLGIEPGRIHVIPYGVDAADTEPTHAHQGGELVRGLAVGRMVAKKAPILLLDAFRRAYEKCPRLRLDYIGTGPLLPAVRQFVIVSGLSDVVTIHGGQPHGFVVRLMGQADLFIQHSIVDPESGDEEGLPVAILEAMAHGLPVVSTRHAGIPEAVLEGTTGLLVDEGDTQAMAERIVELAGDPERRRRMGHAGWERCRSQFSWNHERESLLRVMNLS